MAYDSTTKLITAPVSFYDVQRCLATSANGLKALCTHTGINKWSKKKPVINNSIFTAAEPLWWKGGDSKCGLTIPVYNSLAALIAAYDAGAITWPYNLPTGGAASPYRLTDFANYFHDATSPITSWTCQEFGLNLYSDSEINAIFDTRFVEGNDLNLADISTFSTWYFGIVMTNGTVTRSGSAAANLLNTGFSAQAPTVGIPIDNYRVYPFISPVPMDQNPTTFIPLEGLSKKIVAIYNSVFAVSAVADWNAQLTECDYTIYIENRSGADTITNCYVMLRDNVNDWSDVIMNGEISNNIANIVVPALSRITVTGTITVPNYNAFDNWKFWFVGDAGDVLTSTTMKTPLEP